MSDEEPMEIGETRIYDVATGKRRATVPLNTWVRVEVLEATDPALSGFKLTIDADGKAESIPIEKAARDRMTTHTCDRDPEHTNPFAMCCNAGAVTCRHEPRCGR